MAPPTDPDVSKPVFRSWRSRDVAALIRHANNRNVWKNLKDRFPYPYTEDDAVRWIGMNQAILGPAKNFAIDLEGELVGGVGVDLRDDVYRRTAEIGYWIAEPYWGRGLATEAARFISAYALASFVDVVRLQAGAFDANPASARVLEKAGYTLEARLRHAYTKDGRTGDLLLFTRLRQGDD